MSNAVQIVTRTVAALALAESRTVRQHTDHGTLQDIQFAAVVLLLLWSFRLRQDIAHLRGKNTLRRKRMQQVYGDHF